MDMEQQIAAWDSKTTAALEAVFAQYSQSEKTLAGLLPLMAVEALQKGASWLIKHAIEAGMPVTADDSRQLLAQLDNLVHWESRLHILQCLDHLTVSARQKKRLERFLRACLQEDNKFIRAWAYNGFYRLACQHVEYQQEAQQLLEQGLNEEAASVKARIRRLLKEDFLPATKAASIKKHNTKAQP